MKSLVYAVLIALTVLSAVSACNEKVQPQNDMVGEWKCVAEISGEEQDIRVAFYADYTFELYQKIGDGLHRYYKGLYTLDNGNVTGTYSDGTSWASEYDVTFANGTMIMTSTSSEGYSISYIKERIPDEVKNNCVDMTKSVNEKMIPIL